LQKLPMKKLIMLLLLAIIGIVIVYFWKRNNAPRVEVPKQQPVAQSKYSKEFNGSVNNALEKYYALSEAFVNWDSSRAVSEANALKDAISKLQFDEIKKDTVIYQTATSYIEGFNSDLQTIAANNDITTKRRAFNTFSQNFYDLLRTVKFDASKVYMQECGMPFDSDETAIWLSKTSDIRNPYLGTSHPKYKGGMITCGETKDSLSFGGAQ
jgi:hypothetical protein